jgi:hypothetical protein
MEYEERDPPDATELEALEEGEYYNHWNPNNTNTLKNWKRTIARSSYIYEYNLEVYKTRVERIFIVVLLFSTISTVIGAVSAALLAVDTGIDNQNLTYATLAITVITTVISGIITFLTGIIKIKKWDELITAISKYIVELDNFYAVISSMLMLPDRLREDAVMFIKENAKEFSNLMKTSPDLSPSNVSKGRKSYEKFLEDKAKNYKLANKYDTDDTIVDM